MEEVFLVNIGITLLLIKAQSIQLKNDMFDIVKRLLNVATIVWIIFCIIGGYIDAFTGFEIKIHVFILALIAASLPTPIINYILFKKIIYWHKNTN